MKSRIVAIGSWLFLSALYACGGDDSAPPETDAGMDAGGGESGSGGKGGKGGSGGGGSGGSANAGSGGSGGEEGGSGGSGGSGDDDKFSVGGEVSGLNGSGLVIKLNDEEKTITENGDFKFDAELKKDDAYTVMVKTQPSNPLQACSVKDGSGKVAEADIDNVKIECSNVTRSVGGNVSGLGGGEIKLKNNDGDELTLSADGGFTFPTALQPQKPYAVTISAAPNGRTCNLTKGTGTTGDNNVTDVNIVCYAGLTLATRARVGSVELSWAGNNATSYTLFMSTENCNFNDPGACAGQAKQENVTSPFRWDGLTNGSVYYFMLRGNHPDSFSTRSTNMAGARPHEAEFDRPLNAVAIGGDGTVYVGGQFESVGTYTGPLAPLDKTTGRPTRIPSFPIFTGSVSTVVADNAGGYFVGGAFDYEAGASNTIHNLVHVQASGVVDPAWKPEPNGTVRDMALVGTKLYLAGTFTQFGTTDMRAGLAAVSTTGAGAVDATWNPGLGPSPSAAVNAIVANETAVYVGGDFATVGGQDRANLGALNVTDGSAITTFDPGPNNEVVALALTSDKLYVSGSFNMIGGQARYRLAELNFDGTATEFDAIPEAGNPPNAIAVSGDVVYLGGNFADIDGTPRARLAALNKANGDLLDSWKPEADANVEALIVSGDTIYVAGDFEHIGTTTRRFLAAIDKAGALTSWDPQPGAGITAIAADSDTVYASGNLVRTFGAEAHSKLAAFKGGSLTTWGPAVAGGDVRALSVSGQTVYAGGDFDMVAGIGRNGAAAISDAGMLLEGWNAQLSADADVRAVLADNNRVYLGGTFTSGGGSAHQNIVAVTGDTGGTLSGWTLAGANEAVYAFALDSSDLFFGGDFTQVTVDSPSGRTRLAKVNADTGVLSGWNPTADDLVRALAIAGDNVVVGGDFSNLASAPHASLAAVDKGDAVDAGWNPVLDSAVRTLTMAGDILYVGGAFSTFGAGATLPRLNVAAVDTADNFFLLSWAPGVDGGVNSMVADNSVVYLGGEMSKAGDSRCRNYCTVELYLP
ncbi:MAG TPA: hypothetical protein VFN67_22565 [Polyangiales bacterium]|nr:hypothetical protein [Polyangiales bacterium]